MDENSIAAKHREDDGDEAHAAREAAKARESMRLASDCPRCGEAPTCDVNPDRPAHRRVVVACDPCGLLRACSGATAAEAVARWNALPADFACAGFKGCGNRVDDEDGVCGECEARSYPEGGCPGCGGACQTACR